MENRLTGDDREKIERVAKAIKNAWAALDMPFPLYQNEAVALARAAIKALGGE
jgi:hypothetical protein